MAVFARAMLLGGLCLGCLLLPAQEADSSGSLSLRFDRQNNFTYETRLDLSLRLSRERYRAEIFLHQDNLLNSALQPSPVVQLYVAGQVWQYYRLLKRVELASWVEFDQFWNTRNQRYSGYLGLRFEPLEGLELLPLAGYSWDYRSGRLDEGFSPGLRLRLRRSLPEEVDVELDLQGRYKSLRPRQQHNFAAANAWTKRFEGGAALQLRLQGGSNEMDDYRGSSVERILADTAAVQFYLRYPLTRRLQWLSDNEALRSRRQFRYEPFDGGAIEFDDLIFRQLQFSTRQRFLLAGQSWRADLSFAYLYLGRDYDLENDRQLPEREYLRLLDREQQKDFRRRQTSWDLALSWQPGPRSSLSLTANNRYMQYDSPSEENFDDHDELNYGLSLEWRARWSQAFSTRYRLLGSLRRYAFLFSQRSQDNYTQRNLRLDFEFNWQIRPLLSLRGEQFVYVIYNVKDFEDRNRTDRSTRTLESRLSLLWRPSARWDTEWSFYRKEVGLSYLNWQAFSETALDTTTFWILEQKTRFHPRRSSGDWRWIGELGYRHFSQTRFLNTSMLSLQFILTPINLHILNHQSGPVTGLRLLRRKGGIAEASVWWQVQTTRYRFREVESFTTLSAGYREENLRQVERTLRPFLRLSLSFGR